ncbi:MAG: bifunctional diguanylate cyclase/phosphodiesterase [Pseudomonadota bacterium]
MGVPQVGSLLHDVLETGALRTVFQPIVCMNSRLAYGVEGFLRGPPGHPLESPLALFAEAEREGLLMPLEAQARTATLAAFAGLGFPGKLFMNVNPSCLLDPRFQADALLAALGQAHLAPQQVVLELTEHHPIDDFASLHAVAEDFRRQGVGIAIDDLGAGHASMRLLCELRPDFLKIDKFFVTRLDHDPVKRKVVRGILGMARAVGARVVAEGVERFEELRVLMDMGVDQAQGYLFARPQAIPDPAALARFSWPELAAAPVSSELTFGTAALLLQHAPAFPHDMRAAELLDYLGREGQAMTAIPVVRDDRPLGLISRPEFQERMARLYARELLGREPIANFVVPDSLIVDKNEPLDLISHDLTRQHETAQTRYPLDYFLITSHGRYAGVGSALSLLRRITDAQMDLARHANPLSGLPGNIPIQRRLEGLLKQQVPFTVGYCDIDHFKPFNDVYGYARGDEMLRELAQILVRSTGIETGSLHQDLLDHFVGHVGGDDFVVILAGLDQEHIWADILDRFAQVAPIFYDPEDQAAGGIHTRDRRGQTQFFPVSSLSIGVVPCPVGRFTHPQEIAHAASMVKAQAKQRPGNQLFVDRRQ